MFYILRIIDDRSIPVPQPMSVAELSLLGRNQISQLTLSAIVAFWRILDQSKVDQRDQDTRSVSLHEPAPFSSTGPKWKMDLVVKIYHIRAARASVTQNSRQKLASLSLALGLY